MEALPDDIIHYISSFVDTSLCSKKELLKHKKKWNVLFKDHKNLGTLEKKLDCQTIPELKRLYNFKHFDKLEFKTKMTTIAKRKFLYSKIIWRHYAHGGQIFSGKTYRKITYNSSPYKDDYLNEFYCHTSSRSVEKMEWIKLQNGNFNEDYHTNPSRIALVLDVKFNKKMDIIEFDNLLLAEEYMANHRDYGNYHQWLNGYVSAKIAENGNYGVANNRNEMTEYIRMFGEERDGMIYGIRFTQKLNSGEYYISYILDGLDNGDMIKLQ